MSDSFTFLGVKGGPAIRPGSNMPTNSLLRMGGQNILIDAGLGASQSVCNAGLALTDLDLIVITHLHSDHYMELGPLLHTAWTAGLNRPVTVIGPTGLDRYWNSFIDCMSADILLRIEDEGRGQLQPLADIHSLQPSQDFKSLNITAMRNDHPPFKDSFAVSFASGGKRIVLSGDTAYMPQMAEFAKDADLLVHEAMLTAGVDALCARLTNGDERLRTHIYRSHTDAVDVGQIARDAGVGHLGLHHFVPDGDPDFTDDHWVAAVREHWSGPLTLGKAGLTLPL